MNHFVFLTSSNIVIDGTTSNNTDGTASQANNAVTSTTETTTNVEANPPVAKTSAFGGISTPIIILYVVVLIGFFVFSSRRQKKRAQAVQELRNSIGVGDDVVTTSGLYGKIVDIGNDVFVIEFGTNKGIRIPIAKKDVVGKMKPDFSKPDDSDEK